MSDANEDHRFGDRTVTLVRHEVTPHGYERSRWAVMVDGAQRGWVIHPKGIAKPAQLWSMLEAPRRGGCIDYRTLLETSYRKKHASQREQLAERFLEFLDRGKMPSSAELETAQERARASRESDDRDRARRRAEGVTRDADTVEALMALRERLFRLGVLSNSEADLLETVIGQLPDGYQAGVRGELERRAAEREGVPAEDALPSPT